MWYVLELRGFTVNPGVCTHDVYQVVGFSSDLSDCNNNMTTPLAVKRFVTPVTLKPSTSDNDWMVRATEDWLITKQEAFDIGVYTSDESSDTEADKCPDNNANTSV